MWRTLQFLYFNHITLANVISQKSLHFEFHSNTPSSIAIISSLLWLKLISKHLKWLVVTVKLLSAMRQNTYWNVLNGYGLGRCAFNFKIYDDFWWKWKSIFDVSDSYLSDWSRFHNIIRKKNFEVLTNFTQTRFWDELAKLQFQLIQNTVNDLHKIFWLVGHLVIKTQFAAHSGLGFELPVARGQIEIANHPAVNLISPRNCDQRWNTFHNFKLPVI